MAKQKQAQRANKNSEKLQKRADFVELEKCCKIQKYSQNSASVQPRTHSPTVVKLWKSRNIFVAELHLSLRECIGQDGDIFFPHRLRRCFQFSVFRSSFLRFSDLIVASRAKHALFAATMYCYCDLFCGEKYMFLF